MAWPGSRAAERLAFRASYTRSPSSESQHQLLDIESGPPGALARHPRIRYKPEPPMEPGHLPAPSPPVGIEEDSELAPSRYTAQSSAEGERLAPLLGTKKKRRVPWTKFQSRYGWRLIVWYGFVSGALVFCVNILLLGLGTRHGGYKGGIGTLAQGTATRISTISTAYHVLINIMSTSLLASSNYCMQVLSSPTRQAIDDAHE
jgi:hypothetical protein